MTAAARLKWAVNGALRPLGVKVERSGPSRSWDAHFSRWTAEAKRRGIDPNDIGDAEWGSDLLDHALEMYYRPLVGAESVVLELGPGSGRLSRHLIGKVRKLIVVDNSDGVLAWMTEYLRGKGEHEVHRITGSAVPMVSASSVDAVFAHGVMEHLDLDEIFWFLVDFRRVLAPNGTIVFNFDNPTSIGGLQWVEESSGTDYRSHFRFHAPAAIRSVASAAGLISEIDERPDRIAFALCRADVSRPAPRLPGRT
jgi:ubiquinone/menaquinone biosynthesis C-methylase UbiE